MNELSDLEPQQYQRMYWEEDVPLNDVRKKLLNRFWWIGLVLFFVFLVIAFVVKFPDQVEVPFVLKRNQAENIYRYPYPVYLLDVKASIGIEIKVGDELLEITSPEIVTLVNNYKEAEQNWLNFSQQKMITQDKQSDIILRQKQQKNLKILELKKQLTFLNSQWESNRKLLQYELDDATMKQESYRKLYEAKDISKFEFIEYENKKLKATDAMQFATKTYDNENLRLVSLIEQMSLDMLTGDDELIKLESDTKYDSVHYVNQLALAKSRISNSFGNHEIREGSLILKAGEAGTVSHLFEGDKEVPAGAILIKLIQGDNKLYAAVSCPPSLIGRVRNEQQAFLKVATFPFYEWGSVEARISNQSLTPDEKGNFNMTMQIRNPGKLDGMLQTGMNGNAVVILDEKSFMEYFFRSVKRIYHTTMSSE